jgi:hypothetical protein
MEPGAPPDSARKMGYAVCIAWNGRPGAATTSATVWTALNKNRKKTRREGARSKFSNK